MKTGTGFRGALVMGLSMFALVALGLGLQKNGLETQNTGMADPQALINAFDRHLSNPASHLLNISLTGLRGLTNESLNAGGSVTIDSTNGAMTSQVTGLSQADSFDLWLVDNRSGADGTTLAEPHDVLLRIGTYNWLAGTHSLVTTISAQTLASFYPDRAFVVRSNQTPLNGFVLTGSSTTLDRLRWRQVRLLSNANASVGFDPANASTRRADFAALVAEGRQVFLKEEFGGNGRACGTCHVESNNFTIDPDFIASLPPSDPLFVAETSPSLRNLENSDLIRRLGLILVNADGFDQERGFTLRSVQNVQALANSMIRPDPNLEGDFTSNGQNADPPERLGWGNDGAPLRDFALVAIAQHATKTLDRKAGIDFRVPTDEELDALVAYQLTIGRQEDFNLHALVLNSEMATLGKSLYLDTGNLGEFGHKNCNSCHFNGGGTAAFSLNPEKSGVPLLDGIPHGGNVAAPTKVDDIPLALALGLPRDGGFGQIFLPLFGGYGNIQNLGPPIGLVQAEEFNSPPVVESADTGPFFHNHTVEDLESAVAFYGTAEFQTGLFSIGRRLIPVSISNDPKDPEVQAIAAFLRALNALENIRSSIVVADRGKRMQSAVDARELSALAQTETIDAIDVLSRGAFFESQEAAILRARAHLFQARELLALGQVLPTRVAVDKAMEHAIQALRSARESLAHPATLPVSFRN